MPNRNSSPERRLVEPCCLAMLITACRAGVGAPGRSGWGRAGAAARGRGARLFRLQHVPETSQGANLQTEGSETAAQAVHADLDRGVRRGVTPATQAVGDSLLTHDAASTDREGLQESHLARR